MCPAVNRTEIATSIPVQFNTTVTSMLQTSYKRKVQEIYVEPGPPTSFIITEFLLSHAVRVQIILLLQYYMITSPQCV
jgi:hypothetical protein